MSASHAWPGFLDQVQIRQEPRGLLGRFMLSAERQIQDFGLSVQMLPIADLVAIHDSNEESWNRLVPILDVRCNPMSADDSRLVGVLDRHGRVVSCSATRLIDLGAKTVWEAAEDLTLFFGEGAAQQRHRFEVDLSAPSMARVTGTITYHGGFWVHPDHRHSGLGTVVRNLSRFTALSLWDYGHEISIGAPAFADAHLRARYGYSIGEPNITIYVDGEIGMGNGLFLAVSRGEQINQLATLVADRDAIQRVDRDQKSITAA